MITLIRNGKYQFLPIDNTKKMLILDKHYYVWKRGVLACASRKIHRKTGKETAFVRPYRIYEVKDEQKFTDAIHLELFLGEGKWIGYLLPEGLPATIKHENGIIKTTETITKTTH